MNYLKLKRFYDFFLAFIGLIILSPLFLILTILIKIDSKGPVFFKQKRLGRLNNPFNILKFRTMRIDSPKDTPTHLLINPEKWITKVGGFLRKTSLDELPQFINIFKGDMSFIGPRPALWNQYDLIEERNKWGVHHFYPGLTGYAQINGRDKLTIKDKVVLDVYYAKNISLFLDIKIFFGTLLKVFLKDDIVEGQNKNLKN